MYNYAELKINGQRAIFLKIWSIPDGKEIDPTIVVKAYKNRRMLLFDNAEDKPMFLHEDGSIYTKYELNSDLANLLGLFPELDSPRDKWSGHSFRAGIATLLSLLGFSKEQIQCWGRWTIKQRVSCLY